MGDTDGLWAATRGFVRAIAAHTGRRGGGIIALVGLGAALEGAGIVLLVPILGIAVSPERTGRGAGMLRDLGLTTPAAQLTALLAGFAVLMALRSFVLYRRDVALAVLQTGFVEDTRNRVMTTLAAAPWQRVVGLQHARVTNLLGADVARIASSAHLLIQAGVAVAMLAIQAVIAVALSPVIGGAVVVALVAGGALALARAGWARERGAALTASHLALIQGTTGFLGGLKAAAAENTGDRFVAEFAAVQEQARSHQVEFVRRQSLGRARFTMAAAMVGAAVVGLGTAMGIAGASLIALIVVFTRMHGPVVTIQGAVQNFFFGLPGFEAVRALDTELAEVRTHAIARMPPAGAITLTGATFRHAGGGGIADVDLTMAPGEVVGLAGPSGAGKTTLVDLLCGLIAPQSGSVAVGGVVLDDAGRAGWRASIGYVAQDGFLFHDSVRRNLTWDGAADDRAIAQVLAVTGADAVVAAMPDGLDTVVGERGARLSGGERQRLAIARALLRRPRLLVLDEATSAIDLAGEAALLDRLLAYEPLPTIVIVAHRRESLARCDRMIAITAGRARDFSDASGLQSLGGVAE